MADDKATDEAAAAEAAAQGNDKRISISKIYLKDFSFESPKAPVGIPMVRGASGGVVPHAGPMRFQKTLPS